MDLIFRWDGDGWHSRLSPDGRHVIFGGGGTPTEPPTIRVHTFGSGIARVLGAGSVGRWINDGVATWVRPNADNWTAERYQATAVHAFQDVDSTGDTPDLVGGNDFEAGSGHWASVRVADRRLAIDNIRIASVVAYGVRGRNRSLVVIEQQMNDRVLSRHDWTMFVQSGIPIPPNGHTVRVGLDAWIGTGHNGPNSLIAPMSTAPIDATRLPWRREAAPLVTAGPGGAWAWSGGQRPDTGAGIVIGRSLSDLTAGPCFEVPLDASGALDVVYLPADRCWVVAGSSSTGVLAVWHVRETDPKPGTFVLQPQSVPSDLPPALGNGYAGYFYDHGKYGEFNPRCNCTVIATTMYDTDGQTPPGAPQRLQAAVRTAGAGFVASNSIAAAAPVWGLVHGVWLGELAGPHEMVLAAAQAKADMRRLGLPVRPVIATLMPHQATDPAYADVADWLAPEVYFESPEGTWDEQYRATQTRLMQMREMTARPIVAIVQAYDRSTPVWQANTFLLQPIQQACSEVVGTGGFVGLWWFAYARPGGVTTYPHDLLAWHEATVARVRRPNLPPEPKPPDPPEPPDMPIIGPPQDITQESMARLRDFCINYTAPPDALPQYANTQPYRADELHGEVTTADLGTISGLWISDGLQGFVFETWAPIVMDPSSNDWRAKQARADAALQKYMRRRVGDFR